MTFSHFKFTSDKFKYLMVFIFCNNLNTSSLQFKVVSWWITLFTVVPEHPLIKLRVHSQIVA